MLPLTVDQEIPLKRWASRNLGRPQGDFMDFMMDETGLQQEQIDHWWTLHENSYLNIETTSGEVVKTPEINARGSGNRNLKRSYHNISNSKPIPLDNNMPVFHSDSADWSTIEESCYDSQEFPSTHSMDKGFNQLDTMSIFDADSIPSLPSGYGSKRTSKGSSRRISCTTSTLLSVYETQETDPTNATPSSQHDHTMQPRELARASKSQDNSVDVLSASQVTTRNQSLESTLQQPTSLRHDSSTNLDSKKLPDVPQNSTSYYCTRCDKLFGRKGEWKRHEETKCLQQKLWWCMATEYASQMLDTLSCMLCEHTTENRVEMKSHLKDKHNHPNRSAKPLCDKSFPRKDKLKNHLTQYHALGDSTEWEAWYVPLPESNKAWGCGFCGDCLLTWDIRIAHVSKHYQTQSLTKPEWSLTNEIKGLLKQSGEWDVLTPWNTKVGHNEKLYMWSGDDALILQQNLEYHIGTPQSLVEEAARLARRCPRSSAPKVWPLCESHAVRQAGYLLTKPLRKSPPKRRGGSSYSEPPIGHGKHADVGTQGNNDGRWI